MTNEMRKNILDIALMEYETGHTLAEDKDEFFTSMAEEGEDPTDEMWDFYLELHELGPAGFYDEYKDTLKFTDSFKAEYGDKTVHEDVENSSSSDSKLKKAVGILYAMDSFVLNVYDNEYWLTYGVPDGEFDEDSREAAESNYSDHSWLVEDFDNKFDTDAFNELIDAFKSATDDSDYDQSTRASLIGEAEAILKMNESWEDEYETSERFYIYDEADNCVSNAYATLDVAVEAATAADYPTVKIHRYFRDDKGKLQPDGSPEVIWVGGKFVNESYDKDGNLERCQKCNTLLNDQGTCPKCDDGEEDIDESLLEKIIEKDGKWEVQSRDGSKVLGTHSTKDEAEKQLKAIHAEQHESLNEDTLNEGPFDAIKKGIDKVKSNFDSMNRADKARAKADKKIDNQNYKLLARDFGGDASRWTFKIKQKNGKYKDYNQSEWVRMFRDAYDAIKADPDDAEAKAKIAAQSNAIVVDENGFYMRRGLEDFMNNKFKFAAGKNDVIKQGYSAKADSGTSDAATTSSSSDAAGESTATETAEDTTDAKTTSDSRYDLGITNNTYGHFLKLAYLMKPKLYDAFNKEVPLNTISDMKKISFNNLLDYEIEIDGKKLPLIDWMKSAVKNKVLVEKVCDMIELENIDACDYDDEMELECYSESVDLDEGMSQPELDQLMNISKEIGIKDASELKDFIDREADPDESISDTLRRYRDSLGDDFELKESFDYARDDLDDLSDTSEDNLFR